MTAAGRVFYCSSNSTQPCRLCMQISQLLYRSPW